MLEILLVFFLGNKLGQKAVGRGLSKSYGLLIIPFWLLPEFFGAFLLSLLGADTIAVYAGALIAAGIGAAVAFVVVGRLGSPVVAAPEAPVFGAIAPPPVAPPVAPATASATAGFCSTCGETVWLTPNGACSRGHGAECISGHYTPGT